MSRIPMNPSVACRTAVLRTAIERLDFEPAVPTVDACWLATSAWLWTESLESELSVPDIHSRLRLLARLTIVATVLQ